MIVLPNANTSSSGNNVQFGILDGGQAWTFQWVYSASQLTSVVGDQITAIGFRLPAGASTIASALNYTEFNLQLGTSLNAPGSLSTSFAANQGPDTTTVLSGPLSIPGGSFVGGSNPNSFFDIFFSVPFTYEGGDLLFTLRHDDPGVTVDVDANILPNSVTDTNAQPGNDTATSGQAHFFNSPVTQLVFGPATTVTPEPASLTLLATGAFGILGYGWRKRKQAHA
jgi:hypothetical protein